MAYINGRKILKLIYGGKVIPLVLKLARVNKESDAEGDDVAVSLSTLADVGKYSLFELDSKALRDFK